MGVTRLRDFPAGQGKFMAAGFADGSSGPAFALAGFSASDRKSAEHRGARAERTLFVDDDAPGGMVVEFAQSHGASADVGLRSGLQHFYATGVAPPWR